MLILSSEQIREWDAYTLRQEEITSIDLMERAARKCLEWLDDNGYLPGSFNIYCGKGNNGGDGLALARLLAEKDCSVSVYILELGRKGTDDFQTNLMRLHGTTVKISFIQSEEHLHPVEDHTIVVDALFGYGLNRPLEGISSRLVEHINKVSNEVISIDMPSGMFADKSSLGASIVRARHTLTFQCQKLAFFLPENATHFGNVTVLDINLSPSFTVTVQAGFEMIETAFVRALYQPRKAFSHKGTYGHALLVGGSYGKIGAAVLAAKACLRTGVGLLSCYVPACGYAVLQSVAPEAMVITDTDERTITSPAPDLSKYNVLALGPGMGTDAATAKAMEEVIHAFDKPIVIDADALNILSAKKELFKQIPPFSILTPHPKEFERLFGTVSNDLERLELARAKAIELQVIIVLKWHHSFIAMPGGKGYFNNSGNPGMATGGSGDVLTGILTGLLAQGYPPERSAIAGVYLHGLAGDCASARLGEESLIASDIIDSLADAFAIIRPR